MKEKKFMDVVDLAHCDLQVVDRRVVGTVVIGVLKTDDDEMGVIMGSTMHPSVVREALRVVLSQAGMMHKVKT